MDLAKDATFLAMGPLGSGLGEAVADGCSSAWGVLANGTDQSDEGNCPNKTW